MNAIDALRRPGASVCAERGVRITPSAPVMSGPAAMRGCCRCSAGGTRSVCKLLPAEHLFPV